MNTTREQIRAAVAALTGDRVDLEKIDGIYYWNVPDDWPENEPHPVDRFEESCTHMNRLNRSAEWFAKDYIARMQ